MYVDGCHLKVCPTKSFLVIRFLQKDINHSKTFYLVKILYSYPDDIFHCQVFNLSFLNIMLVPRCLKCNFIDDFIHGFSCGGKGNTCSSQRKLLKCCPLLWYCIIMTMLDPGVGV